MELARKAIKVADKFNTKKKKKFLDLSDEEVLKYHPGVHPDDKRIKGDVRSYQEDFGIKDEDEFFELNKKRKNKLKKEDFLTGGQAQIDADGDGKISANDFKLLRAKKKRFGGMAIKGVKENPPIY